MDVTHLSPTSSAASRPARIPTGPGLRDLALRWLRPDAGVPLRVVRRGRLAENRRRYDEIETMSGGKCIALFFFVSDVRPGGWSVVPDAARSCLLTAIDFSLYKSYNCPIGVALDADRLG